ncbi:hypothetical protein CTRI78_v010278 [Colletotrichum trifolii]|uniref:Secreted protein n=1 Tax=Colletotrichum trifolii TaxID=5466 RepID=A0A4R8QQ81_COLTR|nr:hypothetical protein CTRI78_v010278 [Colletotrichum trifolii]
MKSVLTAIGFTQAAIVLAVYQGYACRMPNGENNPARVICDDAAGTPLPYFPTVPGTLDTCCISQPEYKDWYNKGCSDNGGKMIEIGGC